MTRRSRGEGPDASGPLPGPKGSTVPHLTGDRRRDLLVAAAAAVLERELDEAAGLVRRARRSDPLDPAAAWASVHLLWMSGDLDAVRDRLLRLGDELPGEARSAARAAAALDTALDARGVGDPGQGHDHYRPFLDRLARHLAATGTGAAPAAWPAGAPAAGAPSADAPPGAALPEAVVVLGALLDDRAEPGPALQPRLDGVLRIVGPDTVVVTSGGNGRHGTTEAHAMAGWLVDRGVDPHRVVEEAASTNTVENALESTGILLERGVTDLALVTSASHMRRAATLVALALDLEERVWPDRRRPTVRLFPVDDRGEVASLPAADLRERAGIAHDALRITGLWTIPGVLR